MKKLLYLCCAIVGLQACDNKGGFEGNREVQGLVKHHQDPIPFAQVCIKCGTLDDQGNDPNSYDQCVTADGQGHYEIVGLEKGEYYIRGIGYDSAIGEAVFGGLGVKVNRKVMTRDVPVIE